MINYAHLCPVETFVFNCACEKNFPLTPFVLALGVLELWSPQGFLRLFVHLVFPLHPPAIRICPPFRHMWPSWLIAQEKLAEEAA